MSKFPNLANLPYKGHTLPKVSNPEVVALTKFSDRTKNVLLGKSPSFVLSVAKETLSDVELPWVDATTRNPKFETEDGEGFVYLVQALGTPYFKIGVTKNLSSRLSNLSVGSFTPLDICACAFVEDPYTVESALHTKYAQYWEKGEWFTFPKKYIRQVEITFAHLQENGGVITANFFDL